MHQVGFSLFLSDHGRWKVASDLFTYPSTWMKNCYTNSDWHLGHHWIFLPEVCKMFHWGQRPRATFYELRAKNFQWWSMMPVTICFVISQNQNKKFKQKSFEQKSSDDFNVGCSMLLIRATCKLQCCLHGQHCILVNDIWHDLDQSRAGILYWDIIMVFVW